MDYKDQSRHLLLIDMLWQYRQALLSENFTVNNFLQLSAIDTLLDGLHPDEPNTHKDKELTC